MCVSLGGIEINQQVRELYMTMTLNRKTLWLGWFLFLCCLAMPSMTLEQFFSNGSDDLFGFQAGFWAIYLIPNISDSFDEFQIAMMGIGNIIAILSPLLLLNKNKVICWLCFIIISLVFTFAVRLSFVELIGGIKASYHIGYKIWVIALLTISIGIASNANLLKNSSK